MSSPLAIVTWIWGDRYDDDHVNKLFNGINRHLTQSHRSICFTDRPRNLAPKIEQVQIPDQELINPYRGCCLRLRMFDTATQYKLALDGRIVTFDLDCVIVSELDDLFDRADSFTVLKEVNVRKPCPYNGSLTMLRAGYHTDVWSSWYVERTRGNTEWSDEVWLAKTIPDAASWTGRKDGVWSYRKGFWEGPRDPDAPQPLPDNARIVFFTGRGKKPLSQYMNQPWFSENWR